MDSTSRPESMIIVLGMHRSGTSCLTGSLQQGGLWLGDHSTSNPYNQKGNRENSEIFAFHEQVLRDNGGSWHTPPHNPRWNDSHRRAARELLARHSDVPMWGFKDPRTLLWCEEWLALVPDAALVGIYRHPAAVARSLVDRGAGIRDLSHALELWRYYNRQMLKIHRKRPFPILSFDWDEETFHRCLDHVHAQLGLKPIPEGQRFFDEDLRHQQVVRMSLPWRVKRLYRQLNEISNNLLKGLANVSETMEEGDGAARRA